VDEAEAMEGVADLSPCGSRSRSQSMGQGAQRKVGRAVRLESRADAVWFKGTMRFFGNRWRGPGGSSAGGEENSVCFILSMASVKKRENRGAAIEKKKQSLHCRL
jgi:hypothetical protein